MSDFKIYIEKYRNGELTSAEMHALEKRALSDPFLADALEGAESISSQDFSTDLSAIDKSLLSKRNKATWFTPLRIAAGVIVIVGSAILLYTIGEPEDQLALQKEEAQTLSSADSMGTNEEPRLLSLNQPKEEQTERLTEPKPELNRSIAKNGESIDAKSAADLSTKTSQVAAVEPIKADQVEASELSEISLNHEKAEEREKIATTPVQQEAKREARDEDLVSRSKTSAVTDHLSQKRIVKGQVTSSADGLPLPGAKVSVGGSTTVTMTDVRGNYAIPVPNENSLLSFSFNSLPPSQTSLSDKTTVDAEILEDGSQLSEVVVTIESLGLNRRDTENTVLKLAEPFGGRKAYDKYLENNLRYPQKAFASKVKGKVTINFIVGKDGALLNFTVIEGLGYGCDDEVIRLVKQGPKWLPSTENNLAIESKVTVRLQFDPEKAKK